ncbi:MAG: dihydrodipicolinate reductase C-terminal domain-containing protein [Bacteroidota bacterium]
MRVLIHGYGKVGQLVFKLLTEGRHEIMGVVSPNHTGANYDSIEEVDLDVIDVIIDFSTDEAFINMFEYVLKVNPKVRIVTGTSNWEQYADTLKQKVLTNHMYFLYGANFSIGTALFMQLISKASSIFNGFNDFDVSILDIHHRRKTDMPSGTAKTISNSIVQNMKRKERVLFGNSNEPVQDNQLHVNCLRVGENKGFHEVIFDSANEVIKISQQTLNRENYAHGSIMAAEWLFLMQEPGNYTFNQYISSILNYNN